MFDLGSQTLDKAVTVKLTRTLAIIPITLALALWRAEKEKSSDGAKVSMKINLPVLYSLFRRSIRHYDCIPVRDFGRNHRRNGCDGGYWDFLTDETGEQILSS